MKGLRFELLDGRVREITHHAGCIQPAEAWIAAHRKAHEDTLREHPENVAVARIVEFESKYPINRTLDWSGKAIRDTSERQR